jgi:alkaline phosphatase D
MSQASSFRRREFLRSLAATVIVAGPAACDSGGEISGVVLTPGEGPGPKTPDLTADDVFPQSVASGEPRPTSVIIWTRVEPETPGEDVEVSYVVALDEAMTMKVAEATFTAKADLDHTVKLKVTGLLAGTHHYYQFKARGVASRVGRTKTAPVEGADVPLRFAFASCQDFVGRYYHSWKALLDETSQAGKDLDLIVYLGDYIYETDGDPMFQTADSPRRITLPVGKPLGDYKSAVELADYRALYKQYRRDKTLQAVHERFPFVVIWDDHEFADDSAQDRVADLDNAKGSTPGTDEREPNRRLNATRAWVEFQPIDVPPQAAGEAFGAFKMYRRLTFGKHVEFFMTDQRLFRSGPVVPEGPVDLSVGKTSENTSLGSHYFLLKSGFDAREAAAKPTMLGADQKAWFVDAVKGSQATWKVWGNEVQLWQMAIDLSSFEQVPTNFRDLFYFSVDQWDGFRTERAEVLTALAGVPNLVAITGDVHGFFAAELHPDFDAETLAAPAAAEFVVAGISSQSVQEIIGGFISGDPVLSNLGLESLVPQLDTLLASTNRHLRYANSKAYGVAVVDASAAAFEVTFLQLDSVTEATYAGQIKRTTLRCQAGSSAITVASLPTHPGRGRDPRPPPGRPFGRGRGLPSPPGRAPQSRPMSTASLTSRFEPASSMGGTRLIARVSTPDLSTKSRATSLVPSSRSSGRPSATTWPLINKKARCAMRKVLAMSWLMTRLVTPKRWRVSSMRSSTMREVRGSRPEVGSS